MKNMDEQQQKTNLKHAVFDRIACDNVKPKSRLFFHSRECVVWFLWFVAALIGAFAVAVSLFVLRHRQFALYEATHENFFTFMVDFLPYLWMAIFIAMVLFGIYNLRHTKRGYRYPLWQILLSSLVLSLAGGSLLHFFGFGYKADYLLGQQMEMYRSQEKIEQGIWQNPEEGRLLGRKVHSTLDSTDVVFEDIAGQRWVINTSELRAKDVDLLDSEDNVRMIGLLQDEQLKSFYSCGAFPWVVREGVKGVDFKKVREEFKEHMKEFSMKTPKSTTKNASSSTASSSPCATLPIMQRVRPQAG